jgi:carboxyl-terminal processing protease
MTKAKLTGLFTSLVLAVLVVVPLRAGEKRAGAYVVLVGISQYGDKQIKPRPHADADAKALYDVFADKKYLGTPADHIRLLLGSPDEKRHSEPATHANILKALHWVASQAAQEDLVVLAIIGAGAPIGDSGGRMCYLAADSTLKDRARNAVAAADIQQELDKLKSQHFCAFIDVNFKGYEDGPLNMPEPVFGSEAYREFLGADGKEEHASAPGRALFLAGSGSFSPPDTDKHGLFAGLLIRGLKGAADRAGYEPDGLITVEELGNYLEKEMPELARKYGKNEEQKRQSARYFENHAGHTVVVHNPAVTPRVADELERLAKLEQEKKISADLAAEGRRLLGRMPKLKVYQDLRRDYQKLVEGKLAPENFEKERQKVLAELKLKRSAAFGYAAKVIQATQVIRENYVKDIKQGDLVAWAIRGLYRQLEEKVPAEIRERLDSLKEMSEADLTALLADVRERLGEREDLANHKDLDISLQRMLAHLDPYTTYFDPETVARFDQETRGNFRGIGIQIQENRAKGALEVVTPLKGSPAYKAGIKTGDLILSITLDKDKEGNTLPAPEVISTRGMTTNDAVKKIQGKPGTTVHLTIERPGVDKPLQFDVVRDVIEIESVMGYKRNSKDDWNYFIDPVNRIGYVRISTFARRTATDVKKVIRELDKEKLKGLILDLRFNPGGLLTSAVEISDLFIDDGVIVSIRPRGGRESTYQGEHEGSYLDFPMVCLVNGLSASGSEIVAACLQDHERAVIMGERSYGKGSVQNIQPFEGGELKFTTASFWRPSGRNLNKSSTSGKDDEDWGVIPNPGFTIPLSEKEREQLYEHQHHAEVISNPELPAKPAKQPEFKDRQLETALNYLRSQIRTASKLAAKQGS